MQFSVNLKIKPEGTSGETPLSVSGTIDIPNIELIDGLSMILKEIKQVFGYSTSGRVEFRDASGKLTKVIPEV